MDRLDDKGRRPLSTAIKAPGAVCGRGEEQLIESILTSLKFMLRSATHCLPHKWRKVFPTKVSWRHIMPLRYCSQADVTRSLLLCCSDKFRISSYFPS